MNKPDPAGSTPEERDRQAVAELLGRILAAHWLANRPPANEPLRPRISGTRIDHTDDRDV